MSNMMTTYSLIASAKLGLMCPAQGYDTVTPMRFEPAAPGSRVKHSTTELITVISCWFPTKRDSNQSPQLQRLARKIACSKF